MKKIDALNEVMKMWTWLYRHPAQDQKYYVTHVAKLAKPWKNYCPICEFVDDKCSDCLMTWEEMNGTFCTDPESPFRKWKETNTDNPDYRTLYAGEILAMTKTITKRLDTSA
jgi:hypothetical protein